MNELIKKYKEKFSFRPEDHELIERKNFKYLIIILPLLMLFSIVNIFYLLKEAPANAGFGSLYFNYYAAIFFLSLIFFSTTLYTKNLKCKHILKILPVYLIIFALHIIGLVNCWYAKHLFNGYLVIFIASLIVIIMFEINPIMWSILATIIGVVLYIITIKHESYKYFLNAGFFIVSTYFLGFWKRYKTVKDLRQKEELAKVHRKSEKLLLNILPKKVVEDLENTGRSEPEYFPNVSILFTDIVNFTEISKDLTPKQLIEELNDIFGHFDIIVDKWNCTRIKTIGDAYLAVCGLPEENSDHGKVILGCAQEFLKYLEMRNEDSEIKWKMRIGIHSGSVTAGIVGMKKYIYDIFGESVRIANKMEHYSDEMRINVSQQTFELLRQHYIFEENTKVAPEYKDKMFILKNR